MSRQTPLRIRVDDQGLLEIVDPGWDTLDLLRTVGSGFQVRSTALPGFDEPRFLQLRGTSSGLEQTSTRQLPLHELWTAHDRALARLKSGMPSPPTAGEANLLELKIELTRRILANCTLCAQRCGVDRTANEKGVCRLGMEASVAEHFVHIGEEPAVNPSLLLSLTGCGLRCRYCQQSAILDPSKVKGESLDVSLWSRLDTQGARSLSFVGGNPDESLHAILQFLASAPTDWTLPIVWNCHACATPETLALLDGVVDAFLPDYKYGDKLCGQRLSGIADYPNAAREAVKAMLSQRVPVIARLLVLPGHFTCCHAPVLETLAKMVESAETGPLWVSVRAQYCPDWRIGPDDGDLQRRPLLAEVALVRAMADKLGLKLIDA